MNILLELDPNVVKPGWTPLLITIGLGAVMVLLFRSMRRQFRRVDDHFPEEPASGEGRGPAAEDGTEPAGEPAPPAAAADHRPPPR